MTGIIAAIIPIALELIGYFLKKNSDNEKMAEAFFQWVEKIQDEYLMSANMRDRAKERMKKITEKPFVESP
jgi:GTP-sensing pleiotropic transcriptional regulator CodY